MTRFLDVEQVAALAWVCRAWCGRVRELLGTVVIDLRGGDMEAAFKLSRRLQQRRSSRPPGVARVRPFETETPVTPGVYSGRALRGPCLNELLARHFPTVRVLVLDKPVRGVAQLDKIHYWPHSCHDAGHCGSVADMQLDHVCAFGTLADMEVVWAHLWPGVRTIHVHRTDQQAGSLDLSRLVHQAPCLRVLSTEGLHVSNCPPSTARGGGAGAPAPAAEGPAFACLERLCVRQGPGVGSSVRGVLRLSAEGVRMPALRQLTAHRMLDPDLAALGPVAGPALRSLEIGVCEDLRRLQRIETLLRECPCLESLCIASSRPLSDGHDAAQTRCRSPPRQAHHGPPAQPPAPHHTEAPPPCRWASASVRELRVDAPCADVAAFECLCADLPNLSQLHLPPLHVCGPGVRIDAPDTRPPPSLPQSSTPRLGPHSRPADAPAAADHTGRWPGPASAAPPAPLRRRASRPHAPLPPVPNTPAAQLARRAVFSFVLSGEPPQQGGCRALAASGAALGGVSAGLRETVFVAGKALCSAEDDRLWGALVVCVRARRVLARQDLLEPEVASRVLGVAKAASRVLRVLPSLEACGSARGADRGLHQESVAARNRLRYTATCLVEAIQRRRAPG